MSKVFIDTKAKNDRVPTESLHMTSKRYVDAQDAVLRTYVNEHDAQHVLKTGGIMSGNLSMGGHKVTGLGISEPFNEDNAVETPQLLLKGST